MKWIQNPAVRVTTASYTFEMQADRPAAKVWDAQGKLMTELFLLSSCHTLGGRDVSTRLSAWQVLEQAGALVLTAQADSLIWQSKHLTLTLYEDRILYSVAVAGQGTLGDTELFSGYYTGANERWSNARFYSAFHGDGLFNPEPDGLESYTVSTLERSLIDMTGVPIPGRDHWFFTPPPFCFVLQNGDTCMTLGVTAKAGMHTFTELEYLGGRGQGLVLRYEGYTHVDGYYELPTATLIFGKEPYALLGEFSKIERLPAPKKETHAWWSRPIFCGWGAQSALSQEYKQPTPALSHQKFYEDFTASLDQKRIDPGTIVIDDKWQAAYGLNDVDTQKWPDMKAFIASMHSKGRKVLLWLKAWDPQGVAPALCIRDFAGTPQAIDPENPAYYALFEKACQHMLSSEGLDADGFKIDFTARIPSCPGCQQHGKHWGLELMRDYLAMVHDCAKAVKPDALIMCHCPHPYLADKLDMIRLNDVNTGRPVCEQMIHRAKLVKAVMPDRLIDTDNWPMPTKAAWLAYVRIQPELGIPSLYYLWHMDNSPEAITDEDLDTVRACWAKWNQSEMIKKDGLKP